MDSKYYQYLYKNYKKSVVGIVGMDIYNEIHISNIYLKMYGWIWISNPGPLHYY